MFSIMQALGLPEKFIGVLSAVLVVQPTVGSTLGGAWQRVVATVIGCVLGVVCLFVLPSGYGTAAALALSTLVMHVIAGFRAEWRYGVVAAVALAMGSESTATQAAIERLTSIGIGVGVGTLVTLVVWPDRALRRAELHLRAALRATAARLDRAVKATQGRADSAAREERRRFHDNFSRARDAVEAVRFSDTERLEKQLEGLERLYNSVLFVNRVAEETDAAPGGDPKLEEGLEEIREVGCRIAVGLADGDEGLEGDLERLRCRLGAVREAAFESRRESEEHVRLNALVFALDEVEDGLVELVELRG